MTLTLIANALDAHPHLTQLERAELFHAIETAPVGFPDPRADDADQDEIDAAYEAYFRSEAAAAWNRAKGFYMAPFDPAEPFRFRPTLHQAMAYEEAPTRADILKALDRAARIVKETA